jgi:uncharacterized protein (DUF362 family)
LERVGRTPKSGERWAVKLNLTYPSYLPGVVNSPAFIEGLAIWARDAGVRLSFVEGDGGNGAYSAGDAFEGNGILPIAARYGAACVSLGREPWQWRETPVAGKLIRLPYSPFFARREFDRFITAPLFKNHIFTTATLGLKNLWGCIPDPYRMLYHHILNHGIVALGKELCPDFSIFDGLIGMRGRGPLEGHPVEMNCVLVSSHTGAGELAALDIMGLDLERVRHLAIAASEGLLPRPRAWMWQSDPAPFRRRDFLIRRTALNYLSIVLARVPQMQRLIYHSALSAPIYSVVDRIRGNSAQARLGREKRAGRFHSVAPPQF